MRAMLDYFKTVNVVDFDLQAYAYFSDLVRQKIRIGTQDLRIAAIALSRDTTLVTRNQKDFSRVPGLRLTDWTL